MWHVRPEDVKMAEKLGAGGFAIVYKGYNECIYTQFLLTISVIGSGSGRLLL